MTPSLQAIPDRPISVVLLGYGLAGRVFHGPLVSATEGLSLDAIVTGNADRQQQARAAYPHAAVYPTAEEAWSAGHDLAVIGTANATHVSHATAALAHGVHVVLDKPIAPTAADGQRLADLAASSALALVPFQNRRWDSDFRTALAVAHGGELGRVHRFESRIERMRVVPKAGWRISTDAADMGGMLYDLGAHLVDQAVMLMGPVRTVAASARCVRTPGGTDDDVWVLLEHVDGGVSHIVASQVGPFAEPRMTLSGTHGGLRIQASDSQEARLASGEVPDPADWGVEPAESAATMRTCNDASTLTETLLPLERGAWPAFYRGVEQHLHGRGPAPVLVADVIADLRVLDAARRSASSGSIVRLDPPAGHREPSRS